VVVVEMMMMTTINIIIRMILISIPVLTKSV
jgi:hypothetical protein